MSYFIFFFLVSFSARRVGKEIRSACRQNRRIRPRTSNTNIEMGSMHALLDAKTVEKRIDFNSVSKEHTRLTTYELRLNTATTPRLKARASLLWVSTSVLGSSGGGGGRGGRVRPVSGSTSSTLVAAAEST